MGVYSDFITQTTCVDKTEPQVGLDRIAYNELIGLKNRCDPDHPTGSSARNEKQTILAHSGTVSGGNFTITIVDELGVSHTTANIAYDANAATIEGAIDTKMTADSYSGWSNGDISVALTGDLTANNATLTFDGTSVANKNFGQTTTADVNLAGGGTVGGTNTVQHGQPTRYGWSVIWALGLYETPPPYGELLDDQATLWTTPGENPKWPSAALRRAIAAQAAIDDNNPGLRFQLETLFNIQR